MADSLVPCPSCARHVRVAEAACPFCSTQLPRVESAPLSTQPLRVSRATLFAFGASLAVASCASPSPPYGGPPIDPGIGAADAVVMDVAADGGPPDAALDATVDTRIDAGGPDRGIIPPSDSAAESDSDANADAPGDADGSTAGPYGAPPWPDAF